jgi:probable rRNA maturation factor
MLHLFGHDHMEDDERIIMENKQRAILDNLSISR